MSSSHIPWIIRVSGPVSWWTHSSSPPAKESGPSDPRFASKRFITSLPAALNLHPLGSGSQPVAFYRLCFKCRVNSWDRRKAEESDKELAQLLLMWRMTEEVRHIKKKQKVDGKGNLIFHTVEECILMNLYSFKFPFYMSIHHWWIKMTFRLIDIC